MDAKVFNLLKDRGIAFCTEARFKEIMDELDAYRKADVQVKDPNEDTVKCVEDSTKSCVDCMLESDKFDTCGADVDLLQHQSD